ncbi:YfcE family phosphodiesterase [Pullulanibacillus camelliae]|nr:metallophosphoesterase [Pullulanibacillus camelliae]
MKILIVSDSHGLEDELHTLSQRHQDADIMIHCGDSELASHHPVLTGYKVVAGNCDVPSAGFPNNLVIDLDDHKIFVTHGHLYNVKMTEMNLLYKAEEAGAKIVCFGHTHLAGSGQANGCVWINPGSIRLPRGRREATYAIATWEKRVQTLTVNFYDVSGRAVEALTASYKL